VPLGDEARHPPEDRMIDDESRGAR
jgi:hypothetical protein